MLGTYSLQYYYYYLSEGNIISLCTHTATKMTRVVCAGVFSANSNNNSNKSSCSCFSSSRSSSRESSRTTATITPQTFWTFFINIYFIARTLFHGSACNKGLCWWRWWHMFLSKKITCACSWCMCKANRLCKKKKKTENFSDTGLEPVSPEWLKILGKDINCN